MLIERTMNRMDTRLDLIDPEVVTDLRRCSRPELMDIGRRTVQLLVQKHQLESDPAVSEVLEWLRRKDMPADFQNHLTTLVEALDSRYFDLQEQSEHDSSIDYLPAFRKARAVNGLLYMHCAAIQIRYPSYSTKRMPPLKTGRSYEHW